MREEEALRAEVERLRDAIRAHRDQRGDDRCWMDDCTLYAALPEGGTVTCPPLPPPDEMLENCKRFIRLRHCPGEPYVSPQRDVERLEAEAAGLREKLCLAYDRIAAQSDLLLRAAGKGVPGAGG